MTSISHPTAEPHTNGPPSAYIRFKRTRTPLSRKLVVEFIGTFVLVFTVCTATNPKTGAGALAPLAIGSALMVMVFAGGHISGGHYNPAVSTAVRIRGKLTSTEWASYVATQLLAGVLASLVARVLTGAGHDGVPAGGGKILVAELVFSFALAYVVLHVATASSTQGNSFFGLAIGFTVVVGAFAVGGVSGGAFNPAVALGGSVLGIFSWSDYWIYVVASLLGAALAAGAFLFVESDESAASDAHVVRADRQSQTSPS
jgi:aquaporin Z